MKEKEDNATQQRMQKEKTLPQRVQVEEEQEHQQLVIQPTDTPAEQPTIDNMITMVFQDIAEEDEIAEGPAARTRARSSTRIITQELLLQMTDVSASGGAITAKSAS